MYLAECPLRYQKKQNKQPCWKKIRGGEGSSVQLIGVFTPLFILPYFLSCNNCGNRGVGQSHAGGWRPRSCRPALALSCCIKNAKWKYFPLSIPIRLVFFRGEGNAPLLCRTSVIQRRNMLLYTTHEMDKRR